MDINKGINPRDRKNTMRKIRNLRRRAYSDLSIDDKITLFELEQKLEPSKKCYDYYESKSERKRRTRRRRERRGKK